MSQSPTVALNTWAARHHIPTQYVLLNKQYLPSPMNSSGNHPRTIFYYRLYFGQNLYFDGHGLSHQQARINCACQASQFIQQNQMPMISIPTQVEFSIFKKRIIFLKLRFFISDSTKISNFTYV